MNLDPETCRQLDTLLASIAGVIRQAPESLVCGIVRSELEREVFDRFFDLIRRADGQSDHFTQRIPRRHLRWKQASDFIEANNRRPIRIEELCTITGLSRRGLEYLFMDFSGISAGNYLLKRRLHGLRRELLDAEPFHGEVKRCALTWGFWHLGRLASDYRRCFGEYPKATLCQKMSCAS
jgi:AraC family ethanolamine operon transcriptional activator